MERTNSQYAETTLVMLSRQMARVAIFLYAANPLDMSQVRKLSLHVSQTFSELIASNGTDIHITQTTRDSYAIREKRLFAFPRDAYLLSMGSLEATPTPMQPNCVPPLHSSSRHRSCCRNTTKAGAKERPYQSQLPALTALFTKQQYQLSLAIGATFEEEHHVRRARGEA